MTQRSGFSFRCDLACNCSPLADLFLSAGRYGVAFSTPKALRTHILRLLGPKTIHFKAVGLF